MASPSALAAAILAIQASASRSYHPRSNRGISHGRCCRKTMRRKDSLLEKADQYEWRSNFDAAKPKL